MKMDKNNNLNLILIVIGVILVFSCDSIGRFLFQSAYPDGYGNIELISFFCFSLAPIVIGGISFFVGLNNLLKK